MNSVFCHLRWQVILFSRKIKDIGLHPLVGYILIFVFLFVLPYIKMLEMSFLKEVYGLLALYFLLPFSKKERNDFLRNTYHKKTYQKIRLIENSLMISPFVVVLLLHQCFALTSVVFIIALLFSYITFTKKWNFVIYTPFYKSPFELVLGFRFTFPLFLLFYWIIGMSIVHDNFILGLLSLLFNFLVCVGYYSYQEPPYYLWVHTRNTKAFLMYKIKTAMRFSAYINLIPSLALAIFFPSQILFILLAYLIDCLYLVFVLLLKYTEYPEVMGISAQLMFILCVICPVLFMFFIPVFYKKALLNLKQYV